VLAGYSLLAHQTRLIEVTGASSARAMTLQRAPTLADCPPGTKERESLWDAVAEAAEYQRDILKPALRAITLQNFSMAAWFGGVAGIAAQEIWRLIPAWPWF
jgi:hypothetical protein